MIRRKLSDSTSPWGGREVTKTHVQDLEFQGAAKEMMTVMLSRGKKGQQLRDAKNTGKA